MISEILGYASTLASVVGFQLKKQWQIVVAQLFANVLVALSYLWLGPEQMVGGIVCLAGAAQTFVNFLYYKKGKTPSGLSVAIFFVVYAFASGIPMLFMESIKIPYDLLPFLGSVAFLFAISAKNASITRWLFVLNVSIWIVYDAVSSPIAMGALVSHSCILVSLILGILRYDIFKAIIEKKVAGIGK